SLHFTMRTIEQRFQVAAYADKATGRPRILRGSLPVRNNYDVVTLERTTETAIDPNAVLVKSAGAEELRKITTVQDERERGAARRELLDKLGDKPIAYVATLRAFQIYSADAFPADVATRHADLLLKVAGTYGRELEQFACLQCARSFTARKDG